MTHTTDQERAEFLAWVRTHEECHGAIDEGSAWAAWQAARRATVVPQGYRLQPLSEYDAMCAAIAAAPQPPEANYAEFDRIKAAPVQIPSTAECNTMDCQAGS